MENESSSTPVILYTLGYQDGWSIATLVAAAEQLGAVVVDTRYNPQSRLPQWRRGHLVTHLGDLYEHHSSLGNVNYKNGGPIELKDPRRGAYDLRHHIEDGRNLILMCACKDHAVCHRTHAASFLATQFGLSIVHLRSDSAEIRQNT